MAIEKYSDTSYRVRKMYKGKTYSVYFDHKPTQKEAMQAILDKMNEKPMEKVKGGSVEDYINKRLSAIEKKVSPSTIRGYESLKRNIPKWFLKMTFIDVDDDSLKKLIKEYGKDRSPKSVRTMYGLVRTTIADYRPDYIPSVKLPEKKQKTVYEPTTKDIQRILDYSAGSRYHIVLQLCALGLRRGEAIAITSDDLDGNVLTINKDIVLDKNNKYIVKHTAKTAESNRRIAIPESLADELREAGKAFAGNPHTINEYVHKAQKSLGIPSFNLHYFRHFCVAYLHKHGFTAEQIMAYGGWATDSVMKRAYRYNLDPEESQKEIAAKLGSLF